MLGKGGGLIASGIVGGGGGENDRGSLEKALRRLYEAVLKHFLGRQLRGLGARVAAGGRLRKEIGNLELDRDDAARVF